MVSGARMRGELGGEVGRGQLVIARPTTSGSLPAAPTPAG